IDLQNIPKNAILDILVENNGRINYGPYLTDNRQGITQEVSLNGTVLKDWKMYRLPFEDAGHWKFSSKTVQSVQPALYKGNFNLTDVADTYLDLRSFGKGFVFLNGHNLGKYWEAGPQQTIYIPAVWLKKEGNEIVIFDQLKAGHTMVSTLSEPILDQQMKEL
ncbi:MAG TPA: beta-galactosidase, partial [Pedobacter sp.]